jgi:voltage-gated potassium channel Kch
VLAALAGTELVLAMIGFARTKPSRSLLDSLYASVQLFTLDGEATLKANVFLQVARFLGPCVLGYAAVGAVVAMTGEQFNRYIVRNMRRHVVIAGLGAAGYRLANAFAADGWPVVAIDKDATNVAIGGCRERGVRVLVGDATDPEFLRQAGVDRAELLVALCGEDQVNIDVAAAARTVSARDRSQVLTALAGFDDFDLWQVMKAPALVDRDESGFRLELVNLWAVAAELLLDEYPPFPKDHPGSPHVVVVSDEGLADSLLIGVLRRWVATPRGPADLLRLTLVGASPGVLEDLAMRNPELAQIASCRLERWDRGGAGANGGGTGAGPPPAGTGADAPTAPTDATAVYVALASETAALTTALTLRHWMGRWDATPIVVVVDDDDAGVAHAVQRGGPAMKGIYAFGWLSRTLRPAPLLESTATEAIARLGHLLHCQQQRQLGITDREDPSLVEWEDLPGSLRESNRLWADGIATKLGALHCVVVPAPLLDPERSSFGFTEEEVAELAPFEHERWSADMKRMGYQPGPRDSRHHPLIDVPFEQLPEDNKNKDRAHVRSIPQVLARAGFRVERLEGGHTAGAPSDEGRGAVGGEGIKSGPPLLN